MQEPPRVLVAQIELAEGCYREVVELLDGGLPCVEPLQSRVRRLAAETRALLHDLRPPAYTKGG